MADGKDAQRLAAEVLALVLRRGCEFELQGTLAGVAESRAAQIVTGRMCRLFGGQGLIDGGIDLKTAPMDLQIRGQAAAFDIDISRVELERLKNNTSGFVPLIIGVELLHGLTGFLIKGDHLRAHISTLLRILLYRDLDVSCDGRNSANNG